MTGENNLVELRPAVVNENVVKQLKKMLEEAEAGELQGLAYVGAYRGRGAYSRGLYGDTMTTQQVLFGLEMLKYRIVKEAEER